MDRIVARLILDLHDDGSLSVSGNIGDKALALGMLDSARAGVEGLRPSPLLVPNRDVIAPPTLPLGPIVQP